MSQKEAQRAQVLDRLKEDKISQQEAARRMGITPRQVRRLANRYRQEGVAGLVSASRGSGTKYSQVLWATAACFTGHYQAC